MLTEEPISSSGTPATSPATDWAAPPLSIAVCVPPADVPGVIEGVTPFVVFAGLGASSVAPSTTIAGSSVVSWADAGAAMASTPAVNTNWIDLRKQVGFLQHKPQNISDY